MMTSQALVEIIVLAAIAGFLIFRLAKVLGERHGNEPSFTQAPSFNSRFNNTTAPNTMSPMKEINPKLTLVHNSDDDPISVNDGLQQIHQFDPNFNERGFTAGARAAFETIIKAYARGDVETLQPLLEPALHERFSQDCQARAHQSYRMETQIHQLRDVEIIAARMRGFIAEIKVRFVSEQTSYVVDESEQIVAGTRDAEEVTDLWTFQRDTRAQDPNWRLTDVLEN